MKMNREKNKKKIIKIKKFNNKNSYKIRNKLKVIKKNSLKDSISQNSKFNKKQLIWKMKFLTKCKDQKIKIREKELIMN